MIELTNQQKTGIDNIISWFDKHPYNEVYTLTGFAGTGKTTIIAQLREQIDYRMNIAYIAYTAKAASILRGKLQQAGVLRSRDFCGTLHSLIYIPIEDKNKKLIGWKKRETLIDDFGLIVIDEASMIDDFTFSDIAYYQVPIVAVGDSFQLPPVNGKSSLLKNPNFTLTEIHRQAYNNPIIALSMKIRKEGYIPYGVFGPGVAKVTQYDKAAKGRFIKACDKGFVNSLILAGRNETRVMINKQIRKMLGFDENMPQPGDKIICLKNNYHSNDCPVFNGSLGTVDEAALFKEGHIKLQANIFGERYCYTGPAEYAAFNNPSVEFEKDKKVKMMLWSERINEFSVVMCSMDYFDYGYCLTVHKAQGSQAQRVMVMEERFRHMNDTQWARWLYTAVTRAEKQLLVVGDD